MLIILCVDDARTVTPDKESINNLVKEPQDAGCDLEMEGDFAECLGTGMECGDDTTTCMTQKGLIGKIIARVKMKECKPNKTPALTAALGLDTKGKHWDQNCWDCAGIVGVLLCVSKDTGSDITFAVSQIA